MGSIALNFSVSGCKSSMGAPERTNERETNAGQRRVERECETNAARGSPRREGGRARGGAATRRARIRHAPTPVRAAREEKAGR